MRRITFQRSSNDSLIILNGEINKYGFQFAFDTGASHTVIDRTTLLIADVDIYNPIREILLETGKGIIKAQVLTLEQFTMFGITKNDFEICTYDFLANGMITEIDGVLGLDFISDLEITINLRKGELLVKEQF